MQKVNNDNTVLSCELDDSMAQDTSKSMHGPHRSRHTTVITETLLTHNLRPFVYTTRTNQVYDKSSYLGQTSGTVFQPKPPDFSDLYSRIKEKAVKLDVRSSVFEVNQVQALTERRRPDNVLEPKSIRVMNRSLSNISEIRHADDESSVEVQAPVEDWKPNDNKSDLS